VVQNTLAEVAQLPERTSSTAAKRALSVTSCVGPDATKLYHTSAAVVALPQPGDGGSDWVAPTTVPFTGVAQAVVTGTGVAAAQSLFGAGVALVTQMVKAELVGVGMVLLFGYTRMK
jgi:hypothetical protein